MPVLRSPELKEVNGSNYCQGAEHDYPPDGRCAEEVQPEAKEAAREQQAHEHTVPAGRGDGQNKSFPCPAGILHVPKGQRYQERDDEPQKQQGGDCPLHPLRREGVKHGDWSG